MIKQKLSHCNLIENQKGLTLVEVMVSFAVMALVLLTCLHVLNEAHYMSTESRYRLLALQSARSTLEAIKDTPLAGIAADPTNEINDEDANQFLALCPTVSDANATCLPDGNIRIFTNNAATIGTVTVRVEYTGTKNMDRSLEITTQRSIY